MCGILGTINQPFKESLLDLIKHRGPDDSGLIRVEVGGNTLMLGHRRLAIVDLSPAGHQPMCDASGRCSIIFNGEIYNHYDLRHGMDSVQFKGHSDTETILHYLSHEGIEAVENFNGIFAFGFLDMDRGKLYLARDPFGVKPLYYYKGDGKFIFCSEIKPIQSLVRDEIDRENLAELLRLRYMPSPDTLFKNIRKVRPGHILEVSLIDERLVVREYPFGNPSMTKNAMSFDAATERYAFLFERAVKSQLMSDVEVGVLLSGGIDSAMIAAFAQKNSLCQLKAFTVGFTEADEADEIDDARETSSLLGLDHFHTRIGFNDFLSTLQKCVAIVEEPLATTSLVPMFHLAKLASEHVKVVLSGQGADESLGGYGRYQGEIYGKMLPSVLVRAISPLAKGVGLRNDQISRGLKSLGQDNDLDRFLCSYTVFDKEAIFRLIGTEEKKALERLRYSYDLLGCKSRSSGAERMMSIDLRMNLPDDLLLYTDKISMHYSLECRVPMLDLELVRFIETLPDHFRVKLRKSKIIHKRFAQRVLPTSIIHRKKKGFTSPTKSWFEKNDAVRDILIEPSSKFSSVFNISEVSKILNEHKNGFNRERHIFLLLSIYHWMAEYA